MSIFLAIIVFSILVFIHEFGHFLMAKKNGVKVIEFSIGFGPRLFTFLKGETRYSFKIIPFGGACQMLNKELASTEDYANEDFNKSFENKSVWARIVITLAGPFFNFILALILAIVVTGAVGYDVARVEKVAEESAAQAAGLKKGDIITEYNGESITFSRQIVLENYINPISDKAIPIKYIRDGKEYETTLNPKYIETYKLGFTYSATKDEAVISDLSEGGPLAQAGVLVGDVIIEMNGYETKSGEALYEYIQKNPITEDDVNIKVKRDKKELTFSVTPVVSGGYAIGFAYNNVREKTDTFTALKYSFIEVEYQISTVFKSLGMLFTGQVTVKDFSGPVGIVDMIDSSYEETKDEGTLVVFLTIANLTMLLSSNLGVMNLLPIPGLDGGRFLFQLIEVIFRKPVKHEEYYHLAGMILLMLFAIFVLFQDIFKLI